MSGEHETEKYTESLIEVKLQVGSKFRWNNFNEAIAIYFDFREIAVDTEN